MTIFHTEAQCPRCHGSGETPAHGQCPRCEGRTVVEICEATRPGQREAHDLRLCSHYAAGRQ